MTLVEVIVSVAILGIVAVGFFVFLSNRTYPSVYEQNNLVRYNIRTRMQQVMYQSILH